MADRRPLLLYLPGMDGTGSLFYRQIPALDPFFLVRCVPLPRSSGWTWPALVNYVLEHRDPGRPWWICGESFGACLGMHCAVRDPSVTGLILVNPASSIRQRPWLTWGKMLVPRIPEATYYWVAEQGLGWLAALERILPDDQESLRQAVLSVSRTLAAERLSLLDQGSQVPVNWSRLTMPMLLVAGGADRLLPSLAEVRRLQQHLTAAEVQILPHSGHACLLEQEVSVWDWIQGSRLHTLVPPLYQPIP